MKQLLRFITLLVFVVAPVLSKAQVTASFSGSPTVGCSPLSVTISDASTPSGVSHVFYVYWDSTYTVGTTVDTARERIYASSSSPAFLTLSNQGFYDVVDSAYNTSGSVSRDSIHNYFFVYPSSLTTSVTATSSGVCPGASVTFSDSTSQTVPGYTFNYSWSISGPGGSSTYSTVGTAATVSQTFSVSGSYYVSVTETNSATGCFGYSSSPFVLTVGSLPVACFTTADTFSCDTPASVSFSNCSSGGATHYLWLFGDLTTSTVASPSHTYTAPGSYSASLVAYSSYNCPDTTTFSDSIKVSHFNPSFTVSSYTVCAADAITSGTITATDNTFGATGHKWHDNYVPAHTSTAAMATFTYSVAGTYVITDSAYNATTGCHGITTQTVTVNGSPTVSVTGYPLYRCTPTLSTTLTPTVSGAATISSYEWYFGDSHTFSGTGSPIATAHNYTANGTYSDSLKVTDANGCSNLAVNSSYIHIGAPSFAVTATSADSGCTTSANPFVFTYSTSISSSLPYTVDSVKFGDGSGDAHGYYVGDSTTGTHTYTVGGTRKVTVWYTLPDSLGGCTYADSALTVTVGTTVAIPTISVSVDSICPNTSFSVTASCPSCTSFKWYFNSTATGPAGSAISTEDTVYKYATAGEHYIVAVSDDAGCTDTLHADSVNVLPPAATFTFTATCPADSVVTFNATGSTGASGYHWTFSDGGSATGISPTHTFTIGTGNTYTVILTDSAGAIGTPGRCTNADTQTISIYPFTAAAFSVSPTTACVGQSVTFTGALSGSGSAYSEYYWHFGDGHIDSAMANAVKTHSFAATGIYSDTVYYKNSLGCLSGPQYVNHIDTIGGITRGLTADGLFPRDTVCSPDTVHFADNSTDYTGFTITKRHWNFNAPPSVTATGAPATGNTPYPLAAADTGVYYPQGNYTIIVIDSDNHNCTAKDTVHVIAQQLHAYFYTPDSAYHVCKGLPVPFYDTNTHCTYSWSFGDMGTSTMQNPVHTYTSNGTFNVSVTVTSLAGGPIKAGCSNTYTRTAYIIVDTVAVGISESTPTTAPCILNGVATNTTPYPDQANDTFEWRLSPYPDTTTTYLPPSGGYVNYHYNLTPTHGTAYTLTLFAISPVGCKDSASVNFSLTGAPGGYISISSDSGCSPVNTTLCFVDTNGHEGTNFTWEFNDGTPSVSGPLDSCIAHSYTVAPGLLTQAYSPYVYVQTSGCPTAAEFITNDSIYVNPHPVVTLTSSTGSDSLCYGKSTTITASGAGPSGTYVWSPAAGLSATTGASVSASPTVTTTYTVTGITRHGCSADTTITISVDSELHTITVTGKDSVCNADFDTLVASGEGHTGYSWISSSGGTLPAGDTLIVAPTGSTVVIFKAIFTDPRGCKDTSAAKPVTINPLPGPISGPTHFCSGDSVELTDPLAGGTWSVNDSAVAMVNPASGPVTELTGLSAGYATITYTSGFGCYVIQKDTIRYAPGPISGPVNVCYEDTIHLHDAVTTGGIWSASPASVATITSGTGILYGVAPGIANVSFVINSCPVTYTVTVQPEPDSSYMPSGQNLFVCRYSTGTQVTLTGANLAHVQWFPDVFISNDTITDPVLTDTANIVYHVNLTSIYGCKDSFRVPVTVFDSAYTYISSDTSICLGLSAHLDAISTSDTVTGDLTIYTWSPASTLDSATIHNPIATPDTTTTYTVNIVENPCFSAQRSVTVTVIPQPQLALPGTTTVVAGNYVQLNTEVTNGVSVATWAWTPDNNTLSCDTCQSPIATPTATTTYSVMATTSIGCVGTSDVTVNVICVEASQLFVPNTFTPNGDGNNDRFYLSGKGLGLISRMSVYNRWGERVFEAENINANDPGSGWDGTYRGQVLEPGVFVYVFELVCETGVPFTLKGDVSLVR